MISWFEIPVRDMARAIFFYENLFDTKTHLQDLGDFKLAIIKGQMGSLVQHAAYAPSHAGMLVYLNATIPIEDLLAKAEKLGGRVLRPSSLISEEFGYTGIFEDSEGNRIGLHARQ